MNFKNLERQLICLLVIIVCYVIPTFFSEYFISANGTMKVAPFAGILIIIGLLARWKYIREVGLAFFGLALVGTILGIFITSPESRLAYGVLSLINGLIVFLLFRMDKE